MTLEYAVANKNLYQTICQQSVPCVVQGELDSLVRKCLIDIFDNNNFRMHSTFLGILSDPEFANSIRIDIGNRLNPTESVRMNRLEQISVAKTLQNNSWRFKVEISCAKNFFPDLKASLSSISTPKFLTIFLWSLFRSQLTGDYSRENDSLVSLVPPHGISFFC